MKNSRNERIVLDSWRRCAQAGLSPDSTRQLYPLSDQQLKTLCEQSHNDISAFESCAVPAAASLPKASAFLLVSQQGILLKKYLNFRFSGFSDLVSLFPRLMRAPMPLPCPFGTASRCGPSRSKTTAPF